MKQLMYAGVLAVLLCLMSCKKNKSAEVTYEVSLLAAPSWHGAYLSEDGQVIGVNGGKDGWKHTFTNTKDLSVVTLTAYPDGTDPLAKTSLRIYVNGKQVAFSISPQVQYQFP